MKKIKLCLALVGICLTASASAQYIDNKLVNVTARSIERSGQNVVINLDMDKSHTCLASGEELIVTPMIVTQDAGINVLTELPSVVFVGNRAAKRVKMKDAEKNAYQTVIVTREDRREQRKNRGNFSWGSDVVRYSQTIPYTPEMAGADVVVKQEVCACCKGDYTSTSVVGTIPMGNVRPQIITITPQSEVKDRAKQMTAYVNFYVARYDIVRGLMNNAAELDSIYKFTDMLMKDPEHNVQKISLTGYASPEGGFAYNTKLSQNRANAIKGDIQKKFDIPERMFTVTGAAEDWAGVRSWVASSNIQYRSQILEIIDNTSDPDARDAKIRALDGGKTYNMLLKDVYPGLRRTTYAIDYTVVPFTVERGREAVRTSPDKLSAYEYHVVSQSYPKGSADHENVLIVAQRYYPNDAAINNNLGILALEKGNYSQAITYFQRIQNNSMALNNLGVAQALNGQYDQAEATLRRAVSAGSREAQHNLDNVRMLSYE